MWGEPERNDETDQLFEVVPQSEQADTILRRLLDASASCWNELPYERRQQFFAGESVWDCEGHYDEYVDVLGSATTQQITRVNDAAWRSFFETVEEADQEVSRPATV
jgi:putative transposase